MQHANGGTNICSWPALIANGTHISSHFPGDPVNLICQSQLQLEVSLVTPFKVADARLTRGSAHRGPGVRARARARARGRSRRRYHRWVDGRTRGEGVGCCRDICIKIRSSKRGSIQAATAGAGAGARQRHHPRQKDARNYLCGLLALRIHSNAKRSSCSVCTAAGTTATGTTVHNWTSNITVALTQRWDATTTVASTIHVVIIALCLHCCQVCLARVGITGNLLCLGACVNLRDAIVKRSNLSENDDFTGSNCARDCLQ